MELMQPYTTLTFQVFTCIHMCAMRTTGHLSGKKTGRTGEALNFYLPQAQAGRLYPLAKERHVPMSDVVRFALDRLFRDLDGGQLELPLGIGL